VVDVADVSEVLTASIISAIFQKTAIFVLSEACRNRIPTALNGFRAQ
jgi:hypothetical protein